METASIALVIPALNEEQALPAVLEEVPSELVHWVFVVDNGSTDATASVAQEKGAIVIAQPQRGYGAACWKGLLAAQQKGADIVVFMDGDGSDHPGDLSSLLAPLLEGKADLAIGLRNGEQAEKDALPIHARFGNWLVSRLINLLYGCCIHDLGSFRALRCATLETLRMKDMSSGWPVEMLVKAARQKYRIAEIPLRYRKRKYGHSKVASTFTGSILAAYLMLKTTFKYVRSAEA
ncbi:glycosyltransferase family 2 protein [Ktedonosporobacter rubrisoli]|uniref:Glycosyltransferase family 2 protein n=1 Tax=Ktedonosporobacter rubrisoli TaxID=2509675 RepID=A0A4P6JK13_KTERU|nr:glycosyltransferase family 2 protein [Ktedonosporobacter rubrisoli]QBD74966.1 glycosyltransferase family 2 protein [Ktedonosporobacter rubrisoli]